MLIVPSCPFAPLAWSLRCRLGLVFLLLLLLPTPAPALDLADLPLLLPDVSAYQVSSHNKRGLNGDGGWYLHPGEIEGDGLVGWSAVDEGASAAWSSEQVHAGRGALVHTIRLSGLSTGWRSVRKEITGGLNLEACDRLALSVWPTHADGGTDYGVRIDSGGVATEIPIPALEAGRWNSVELDVSKVPRQGVEALWLLFRVDWGARDGMSFWVDDIRFLHPDGTAFEIDDFETGARRAVLFDAIGPGSVCTIWGLGEHDIRIEVDGAVVVDAPQVDFFEGRVPGFPVPFVRKALVASGPWACVSHYSFVPIGFRERCRITTRHPAPFYHVIAERYRDAARVLPWTADQELGALKALWDEPGRDPKGWKGLREARGKATLAPGASVDVLALEGAGAIATIRISLAEARDASEGLWLVVDSDGGGVDVEAPLGFFFGAGVRWQDIPSAAFGIRGREGYCHFPMPFWKSVRVRLENRGRAACAEASWFLGWRTEAYPERGTGYFRARFREGPTALGRDWIFLETAGQGHFVGVVHRLIGGHYCEGDIRFYLDGSRTPAFYGTGTEDYYHQACWPNRDNHTPYHGCVGCVATEAKAAGGGATFYDFPACYYRVHLDAPVRYRRGIRCGIEHGGVNDTESRYATLAFSYERDEPALHETCSLAMTGAGVTMVEGFFEGDDDDVAVRCAIRDSKEAFTAELAVDPANEGVRLRRVLDASRSPQRAAVTVDGVPVGTWYDPERNPYKRLAESDFEIAPALVRGKAKIRVLVSPEGGAWTMGELRAFSHVEAVSTLSHPKSPLAP